jgi:hypothetical protein
MWNENEERNKERKEGGRREWMKIRRQNKRKC